MINNSKLILTSARTIEEKLVTRQVLVEKVEPKEVCLKSILITSHLAIPRAWYRNYIGLRFFAKEVSQKLYSINFKKLIEFHFVIYTTNDMMFKNYLFNDIPFIGYETRGTYNINDSAVLFHRVNYYVHKSDCEVLQSYKPIKL